MVKKARTGTVDHFWQIVDRANRLESIRQYGSAPLAQVCSDYRGRIISLAQAFGGVWDEVKKRVNPRLPAEVALAEEAEGAYNSKMRSS